MTDASEQKTASRVHSGVTYSHPVQGHCRLIAPDPEDGALLIMERVGDDFCLGSYFACERSNLFEVGARLGVGGA